LSVFQKVMALKTFEHNFSAFLHAPMDQDGIDKLISLRQTIVQHMSDDSRLVDVNWEFLHDSIATVEKVWAARIALFVLAHLNRFGMDGCSLDVVLGRWQAFHCRYLLAIITRLISDANSTLDMQMRCQFDFG
jgi:hypothetical protein